MSDIHERVRTRLRELAEREGDAGGPDETTHKMLMDASAQLLNATYGLDMSGGLQAAGEPIELLTKAAALYVRAALGASLALHQGGDPDDDEQVQDLVEILAIIGEADLPREEDAARLISDARTAADAYNRYMSNLADLAHEAGGEEGGKGDDGDDGLDMGRDMEAWQTVLDDPEGRERN